MSESRAQVIEKARKFWQGRDTEPTPITVADFAIAYHAEQTSAEVERLREALDLIRFNAKFPEIQGEPQLIGGMKRITELVNEVLEPAVKAE